MASKFGQLLLRDGLITQEQLDHALEYQKGHGGRLGEILNLLGYISSEVLMRTVASRYGVATLERDQLSADAATLSLIPPAIARAHRLIPLSRSGPNLTCAMEDPTRVDAINAVQFQTGCNLRPVLVPRAVMDDALERFYPAAGPPPSTAASPDPQLVRRIERLSPDKRAALLRFLETLEK